MENVDPLCHWWSVFVVFAAGLQHGECWPAVSPMVSVCCICGRFVTWRMLTRWEFTRVSRLSLLRVRRWLTSSTTCCVQRRWRWFVISESSASATYSLLSIPSPSRFHYISHLLLLSASCSSLNFLTWAKILEFFCATQHCVHYAFSTVMIAGWQEWHFVCKNLLYTPQIANPGELGKMAIKKLHVCVYTTVYRVLISDCYCTINSLISISLFIIIDVCTPHIQNVAYVPSVGLIYLLNWRFNCFWLDFGI